MPFDLTPPPSRPTITDDTTDTPLTPAADPATVPSVTSPLTGEEQQEAPPLTTPALPEPPQVSAPPPRASAPSSIYIPRYLEGRQTHLLAGSSGAGKTTFAGWLAARLLKGESTFGYSTTPPPFMAYIAGDRTVYDALHKLEAAGWPSPAYYSLVNDHSSTAANYIKALRTGASTTVSLSFFQYVLKNLQERYFPSLSRIPEDSLLWVDGMAPFFGIEPSGSYMKSVAAPLIDLNRFADFWRVCPVLIHHASKQKTDAKYQRAQDRALGSVAVQGFTSTQMFITEPELSDNPDANQTIFEWRSHSAPHEAHAFTRSLETGMFDYIGPHWNMPPQEASTPVKGPHLDLLTYLGPEWIPASSLREHVPLLSKATFYRYLDQLATAGLIDREEHPGLRGSKLIMVRLPPSKAPD